MSPGLLVQVMRPATQHRVPAGQLAMAMDIVANVAMMCGCPISNAPNNPRLPSDFDVSAQIREGEHPHGIDTLRRGVIDNGRHGRRQSRDACGDLVLLRAC